MEVEHVIPQSLARRPNDLKAVIEQYGLPDNFDLFSFENLRPAHGTCNRLKSNSLSPILAFEISHGVKKANNARNYLKKMSSEDTVLRALTLLENERQKHPFNVDVVKRLISLTSDHRNDARAEYWNFDYQIPSFRSSVELMSASANIAFLAKRGQTFQLGMFLGAIIGASQETSPFAAQFNNSSAKYEACFKGLKRGNNFGPKQQLNKDLEILAYVQSPNFGYRFNGEILERLPAPKNSVFVSMYSSANDFVSHNTLQHFSWVESDPNNPLSPMHCAERYVERLW